MKSEAGYGAAESLLACSIVFLIALTLLPLLFGMEAKLSDQRARTALASAKYEALTTPGASGTIERTAHLYQWYRTGGLVCLESEEGGEQMTVCFPDAPPAQEASPAPSPAVTPS